MRLIACAVAVLVAHAAVAQEPYRLPSGESATHAGRFLNELVLQSPDHDGTPLREYWIQDVDLDGTFEVLESLSEVEERTPGFLSAENAPPCYWIHVYQVKGDRFRKATGAFRNFLIERRQFYRHWIQYLDATDSDPQRVRECADRNSSRVEALLTP